MLFPQHHQCDEFDPLQRQVFAVECNNAVNDHFALYGGDVFALFPERNEAQPFFADALQFKIGIAAQTALIDAVRVIGTG